MRYQQILEHLYCRPWYISASGYYALHRLVQSRLGRGLATQARGRTRDDEDEDDAAIVDRWGIGDFVNARPPFALDDEGIAHLHVTGPIGKGLSKLERACGSTGIEQLRGELRRARGARGLMLHVNSPGGTITGVPELAEEIAAFDGPKLAYTEDMMCSAAYFLSAGCDLIAASESADVGSIGVFIPWIDFSAQLAAEGLQPDPIVNTGADLKAAGFTGSLSEAQRAFLQEDVDRAAGRFHAHVRTFRDVPDEALRGQSVDGARAAALNLVDYVGTEAEAYAALLRRAGVRRPAR